MGLNRKRLLTALYFPNRIIQRNFPLRTFTAPNVGNSFMAGRSFFPVLLMHFITAWYSPPTSLPTTGALTVAVALLTSRFFFGLVAARRKPRARCPEVQETARAVSSKIVLCRLFRTVAPDTVTAVFELRQIVLGDSFPALCSCRKSFVLVLFEYGR